jgi:two-component system, chemotaxis family, protein-glutamate methylesterase/glutaminase
MKTNTPSIRVLVVDDSVFMRNTISTMLMKFSNIQVVGTAQNGMEAIEHVKRIKPDVMTLDIDMPGLNGLDVLDYVMAHHPLPVIMISASTKEGAKVTLQALERGAVDFIPKDVYQTPFNLQSIEKQLHDKVQEAYQARFALSQVRPGGMNNVPSVLHVRHQEKSEVTSIEQGPGNIRNRVSPPSRKHISGRFPIVVIGSSSGGPNLLKKVVRDLPVPFSPCLIIIQHMPKFFTNVFSENLNAVASFPIREACNGDPLEPGTGLVAPGDQHLFIARQSNGRAVIKNTTEPAHLPYRPSIDCAMASAAQHFGSSVIGVVISGMGNDGVRGCQQIKEHGGIVLVQNEATALIYGMPRAVVEAGWADAVVSDGQLAECIVQAIKAVEEKRVLTISAENNV